MLWMKYKLRPSELLVAWLIVACLLINTVLNWAIKRDGLWREYEILGWLAAMFLCVAISSAVMLIKMKRSDREKWRAQCMNCGNALADECNGTCPHCGLRQD